MDKELSKDAKNASSANLTAVEWLAEQMLHPEKHNPYIEKAKEIEKKQQGYSEEDLEEAFIAGGNSQIEEDDAYGSAYTKYMKEWFEQFKKK
jgi:hypothetical protein